jgi:mannose-6-phosphate isomerase-like protein (cupin superfamily)
MSDIVPASSNKLDNLTNSSPSYELLTGSVSRYDSPVSIRTARMRSSESIAAPGCATPMHLHRSEEEHFVIIAGSYRIAIGEKIFEASAGASITLPKGAPHSWRNISREPGRTVVILTPGDSRNVSRPSATALPRSLKRSLCPLAATS